MNKQSLGYTIIFTFLVTFVFVLALSFTNVATVEQVELNQELFRISAILDTLGIEYDGTNEARELFEDIEQIERGDLELFRTTVNGTQAYAKRFEGAGLWGTIIGYIAVNEAVDTIVGLEILEDNETPGLGGRINESQWKDQFDGESIPQARITVEAGGDPDPDKDNAVIHSITGATRTSEAMEVIINRELDVLRDALQGGDA